MATGTHAFSHSARADASDSHRVGGATGFEHVGDLVVEALLDLADAQAIADIELVLRLRRLRAYGYRREDVTLRDLLLELLGLVEVER